MKARVAVLALLLPAMMMGQTQSAPPPSSPSQSSPSTSPAPKKKAKHVWTNDDIRSIRGGISTTMGGRSTSGGTSATGQRPADEPCELDPWVAGFMAVLKAQGVPVNQKYWQTKLFGGVCKEADGLGALTAADGVNSFDDGTNFTVRTQISETWPQGASMVEAAKKDHPFLVSYNHEPYVAVRVNWIDHRYSDGGHVYVVSKVTMKHPLTGEVIVFDAGDPDAMHIDGTLVATVGR
ncbi:MAG TPA: hypothetical protein VFU76_11475 [Terriglobales bacterium]|nr:hypothetical protein [Terriglobales bacterium]